MAQLPELSDELRLAFSELAGVAREGLLAMSVSVGMRVLVEMMEEERQQDDGDGVPLLVVDIADGQGEAQLAPAHLAFEAEEQAGVEVSEVSDPDTRAYVERRTKEGRSKREIMRCLKRYVARELYPLILVERRG